MLVFFLFFIPTASAELSFIFDIDSSGDARYIIEYRTLLDSQSGIDEFNEFERIVEGNITHKQEFERRMKEIVSQASTATAKSMKATDFDISVSSQNSPTGNFGIVRYSFKWTNFADVSGSSITVGNVFFGGQYISSGDSFIIKVPKGRKVYEVEPAPDISRDNELVWSGPKTFESGQPMIVFNRGISWMTVFPLLILAGSGFYLFKKKKDETRNDKISDANNESPARKTKIDLASDEDRIVSMLKKHGGMMMQSEIVKEIGVSKSKISNLLVQMDKIGLIQRVRKGRENLIRLN